MLLPTLAVTFRNTGIAFFFFFPLDAHFPSVGPLSMSISSFTCDSYQRYRGSKVTAVFQPVDTPSEFVSNDCITVV